MRYRLLNLYILVSSAIFSCGLFICLTHALRGMAFFDPRTSGGVTGDALFYSIRKRHDLFTYYSSLLIVPVLAVFLWFIFFRWPAGRLSGGRKKNFVYLSRTLALPFSLWYFTIPGASFFGTEFFIQALAFLVSVLVMIGALRLRGSEDKKGPAAPLIAAFILYPLILKIFISGPGGPVILLYTATALLLVIFWLYQRGNGVFRKKFGKTAALFTAVSFILIFAGTVLSGGHDSVTVYVFIFFYAACVSFLMRVAEKSGSRPKTPTDIPRAFHIAVFFYGYTIGVFCLSSYGAGLAAGAVLWAIFHAACKSRLGGEHNKLKEKLLILLISLSPLVLLHLKAPLYITFFGRYSNGTWIYAFSAVMLLSVAFLCAAFYLFFIVTGKRAKEKMLLWVFVAATVLVTYAALFNPVLDGTFDYFHEAESIARASLFSRGYGLKDLYLVEHGLVQDLGIGLMAARIFGPTLEGLRTFLMYLNPLSAIALFILCFTLFKKKSLALTAFILAMAVILTSPVKSTPYPLIHKNFLRLIMPSLSLAFFVLYVQKKHLYLILLFSATAFAAVVWSIDTGVITVAAIAISAFVLDFYNNRFSMHRYRAFPCFIGAQGVILALVLLIFGSDLLYVYIEVFIRQSGVVQTSAHTGIYPLISEAGEKTFFLAYVNPSIIIFSITTLLWLLIRKRFSEKDIPLFALTIFAAAFFVRGVGRTDSDHIIFSSVYVPVLLTLTTQRLRLFLLKGRSERYTAALVIALVLFFAVPYRAQRYIFFPLKTSRQLIYKKTGQKLRTALIGNISISDSQANTFNSLINFFSKEKDAETGIYDFTNNYGVTLWILGADPITRFLFVANANTAKEQGDVVRGLDEKKPGYVIFKGNDFFSRFDGIDNVVRHPLVADYILRHYTPYASVSRYRILKRKDLVMGNGGMGKLILTKNVSASIEEDSATLMSMARKWERSEYAGTLSAGDLFWPVDLGYIPYYLSRESRGLAAMAIRTYTPQKAGAVELKGLNLGTGAVSGMIVEASSTARKARIFWSEGAGYSQNQSITFSLKNDAKTHGYALLHLSSIPAWHYLKSINSIKITAADGGVFKVRKIEILP